MYGEKVGGPQVNKFEEDQVQCRIYIVTFWTPHSRSYFLHFIQFLATFAKIIGWQPLLWGWCPRLWNPGCAVEVVFTWEHRPPPEQTDTTDGQDWKHDLPATSLAGGKDQTLLIFINKNLLFIAGTHCNRTLASLKSITGEDLGALPPYLMYRFFSARNSSCGKVMFSQVSVNLFTGEGVGYL